MISSFEKDDLLGEGLVVWIKNPYSAKEERYRKGNYAINVSSAPVYVPGKIKQLVSRGKVSVETIHDPIIEVTINSSDLFLSNSEKSVEDMINLVNLNIACLLDNVQNRFHEDQQKMYTYAGKILLAVNPYRELLDSKGISFYDESYVEKYRKDSSKLEPHIFQVANSALNQMIDEQMSQGVVISGESGAGKTESTKQIMKFITSAFSKGTSESDIENRLLQTNPVLEALGNATTLRNDNSSRFGKFIKIIFDGEKIVGGSIQDFLLEKSRVVFQLNGERNYHAFYYLIAGADATEVSKYKLLSVDEYTYLNVAKQGKRNASAGKNASAKTSGIALRSEDKERFLELKSALQSTKVPEEIQETLFKSLSAVLLLGNCELEQDPTCTQEVSTFTESSVGAVKAVAELLGLEPKELETQLLIKTTNAGSKSDTTKKGIVSSLTVKEAYDGIYALSKCIYEKLFRKIVKTMNESLLPADFSKYEGNCFIGILDIFGFEVFDKNGFEQLCINFANEKLQQLYTHYIFKLEEKIYREEGIDYSDIKFEDNQDIIELIEKRPVGIFSLLNEACLFPRSTDSSFINKCNTAHAKTKRLYQDAGIKSKYGPSFIISHSAAKVTYSVDGFISKNRDRLRGNIVDLMQKSKNATIASLFDAGTKNSSSGSFTGSNAFLGSKFKDDINELMEVLKATNPHFIRCIKSNTQKRPRYLEHDIVLHQLRYLGVLESIRIRHSGFCYRDSYEKFYSRFALVVPALPTPSELMAPDIGVPDKDRIKMNAKKLCKELWKLMNLSRTDAKKWDSKEMPKYVQYGSTKIFMRKIMIQSLEALRSVQLRAMEKAASKIQALARMRFIQNKLKIYKRGCERARSAWRAIHYRQRWLKYYSSMQLVRRTLGIWINKRRFQQKQKAIRILQNSFRRRIFREDYLKKRSAVKTMQSLCRRWLAKKTNAVLLLQATWKGVLFRKQRRDIVILLAGKRLTRKRIKASKQIQHQFKTFLIRRKYLSLKLSSTAIQRWYRALMEREYFKKIRVLVFDYQRVVRGFIGRCRSQKLRTKNMLEAEKWSLRNILKKELKELAKSNRTKPPVSWIFELPGGMIAHRKCSFSGRVNPKRRQKAHEVHRTIDVDAISDVDAAYPDGWSKTLIDLEQTISKEKTPDIITNVSIGNAHSVGLTRGGDVFTWGWGDRGQLGHGNFDPRTNALKVVFSPTKDVGFKVRIIKIATGSDHTMSLCSNGIVYTWGAGGRGQLGHGDTYNKSRPRKLDRLAKRKVRDIACSSYQSLALLSTGSIYSWGMGGPALGHGVYIGQKDCLIPTPIKLFGTERARVISAGSNFSAAATETGRLYTWGWNDYGQLGLGDLKRRFLPQLVTSLLSFNIETIRCGGRHCGAVSAKAETFVWGWNAFGQLGLGDRRNRSKPCKLKLSNITQIACGWRHTVALRNSATEPLYFWGVSNIPITSNTAYNQSEDDDEEQLRLLETTENIYLSPTPAEFNQESDRLPKLLFTSKFHSFSATGLLYEQKDGPVMQSHIPLFGKKNLSSKNEQQKSLSKAKLNVRLDDSYLARLNESIETYSESQLRQVLGEIIHKAKDTKEICAQRTDPVKYKESIKLSVVPPPPKGHKPIPPFMRQSSAELRDSTSVGSTQIIDKDTDYQRRRNREGVIGSDSVLGFFQPDLLTRRKLVQSTPSRPKAKSKRKNNVPYTHVDLNTQSSMKLSTEKISNFNYQFEEKEGKEHSNKFMNDPYRVSSKNATHRETEMNVETKVSPRGNEKHKQRRYSSFSYRNEPDEEVDDILKRIKKQTSEDMKHIIKLLD